MTQDHLSKLTGISKTSIGAYELGKKVPNTANLVSIAVALNVSLNWLCGFRLQGGAKEDYKQHITEFYLYSIIIQLEMCDYDPKTVNAIKSTYNKESIMVSFIDDCIEIHSAVSCNAIKKEQAKKIIQERVRSHSVLPYQMLFTDDNYNSNIKSSEFFFDGDTFRDGFGIDAEVTVPFIIHEPNSFN